MATKDITVPQAAERNLTEVIRVAVPERSIAPTSAPSGWSGAAS